MSNNDKVQFRISSALKNLIGKELITNEFIAVFELVKNSFDARATEVQIIFENLYTPNPKLIIVDNGKGMDYDDLFNKWLFVAYSAKKDGTEDEDLEDYRDKIKPRKYYAGAKGVGRFSCDRLGRKLNLISIKESPNAKIENLKVNWGDFEQDAKKEFKEVDIVHQTLKSHDYDIEHGTILEITGLRETNWDRDKILDLKDSLAKLILPTAGTDDKSAQNFQIFVQAEEEKEYDQDYVDECKSEGSEPDPRKLVNGPVVNFIFETLNLKTTRIEVEIEKGGETVTSKLFDRGIFIYELVEKNSFKNLNNIQFNLFFLNRPAKYNFTRKMGVQPVNYGNVFIYKNGFRIHPYGVERDDSLGIDARKAQGYKRFLGTRELIGRIEILGINSDLRETTSRDGGLIKTKTYDELVKFFIEKVLRKLEKYVVDAKNWGVEDETLSDFEEEETKDQIVKLLANLSKDSEVISVKYNDDIIDLVSKHESNSAKKLIKNFKRIAAENKNDELLEKSEELENKLKELRQAKDEAEKQVNKERQKYEKEKEYLKKENKYLLATAKDLSPEALGLIHHIQNEATKIGPSIESITRLIRKNKFDREKILNKLQEIKFRSDRVVKISNIVTRSNFNLQAKEDKADLVSYILEYLMQFEEINKDVLGINIDIESYIKEFIYRFSKIDVSLIFDNLLSNSFKAGANNVKIILEEAPKKGLKIVYSDDGKGVNSDVIDSLFKVGVTTTTGSGLGMFTVKKVTKDLGANIKFIGNDKVLKGATFEILI